MQILYRHNGVDVTDKDLLHTLRQVGIQDGDTIFVHSDIKMFGKIALTDKTMLLHSLVETLKRSVGTDGTVVMPTFTFSFCKNEPFDVNHTRSTVGSLTDFFRTESGVRRSVHPIFSVAAWGAHADEFMRISKDSFGDGTAFETLRRLGGKLVLLGTQFDTCSFLHHLEQIHQVPYRYFKTFDGTIIDGELQYHDAYTFFVRNLDGSGENDFQVVEPLLRSKGLLHEALLGGGRIMSVSAQPLYAVGMRLLDTDPLGFTTRRTI